MNNSGKRRENQKVETYALILKSARVLFETQGFKKTTIRAIALHAGIATGTSYKHFENKTSILAAAFYEDLSRLFKEATKTIPYEDSLKNQFEHLVKFNLSFYTSKPQLSREYLRHIAFADEDWLEQIEGFEKSYLAKVNELVSYAQQRGEVDPDRDCEFTAFALMANYFWFFDVSNGFQN